MEHEIKFGDLGRVPVPHANAVFIHLLHKTTIKIVQERNCEQEFIRLSPGLTQEGMLAGVKVMIRCRLLQSCWRHKVGICEIV